MINWLSTEVTVPDAGREIVAKNHEKEVSYSSAAKQCRVMKFLPSFSSELIKSVLLDEGFTLWAYTG